MGVCVCVWVSVCKCVCVYTRGGGDWWMAGWMSEWVGKDMDVCRVRVCVYVVCVSMCVCVCVCAGGVEVYGWMSG